MGKLLYCMYLSFAIILCVLAFRYAEVTLSFVLLVSKVSWRNIAFSGRAICLEGILTCRQMFTAHCSSILFISICAGFPLSLQVSYK